MEKNKNRKPIGRGLEALLTSDGLNTSGSSSLNEIELVKIMPNPDQPRSVFEEETLDELAASIRTFGVIQPITLKDTGDENYIIICGERRYRAAKLAGLDRIPAYVKTAADEDIMEMALLENIQREDLNAIEIALAYQKLIDNLGQTQEQLGGRIGKKRTTISNYLRLLKLPAEIQVSLKNRKIDMGHARALITIEDPEIQLALHERILSEGLSVRSVEEIARTVNTTGVYNDPKNNKTSTVGKLPEEFSILKEHLSKFFGTKVQLSYNPDGKGKITIPFDSDEKLANIMGLLDRMK
ncbi:MAG: ParB/RepB/Spo0J family partition protein [Tannerella sp.]|jgi:ParB family chromosome partitioning protein|nr:ParB/RepB/Spo0J family partition protein [Tannerella sp.]